MPKTSPKSDVIQPIAVNLRGAARMLGISEQTVRALTRQNKLHARKTGHLVLYSIKTLEAFLAGSDEDVAAKSNER